MNDDLTRARAYLDNAKRIESLTDEQRAEESRRRQILGSLDDTHALNRAERGSADALAVAFCAVAFLLTELTFAHPHLALAALAVCVLWVAVALPFAVVIGRRIGGQR